MNTITTTNTTNTTTTNTAPIDATTQAMINAAVSAALAAANKTPQKTEAELKAENAALRIKENLGTRIMRDVRNDASVRVGLRTAMSQGLIAGGALSAIGYAEEGAMLLAQGEQARFAQRKGLRAEGATGTVRAGLSYIPFVGDLFLGGDSVQERALYAQTNAHAAQQRAMGEVAMMVAPVAEQIKGFLQAGTAAQVAAADHHKAIAAFDRGRTAASKHTAQKEAIAAEAAYNKAVDARNTADENTAAAMRKLSAARSATPMVQADVDAAERAHLGAMAAAEPFHKTAREASQALARANAVVDAFG